MDGFEIPIGGDLGPLAEAFDKVIASIDGLGEKIVAALAKSNAAIGGTSTQLAKVTTNTAAATAATTQLGAVTAATMQRMQGGISTAANLGTALTGLQSGAQLASRATRILTGVNLGQALQAWISRAGGIRAAFAKIPAALSAVARNPVFRRIAIGAAAAIVSVLAIRTAWRAVSAGAAAMGRLVSATFSRLRAGAAATANAMRSIASMPGKMLGAIPGLPIAGILGGAGAVALLATQLKGASNEAAVFEDLTVSVEHFTGSAEKAKDLLSDLASFAIKTPFETIQVQQTAGTLLGAGIKEDVAGITKDLAAMARNGQELGELGDALGKGFAKGKFQTDEVNKFLERGINLNPALQAQIGLTGDEFTKAVQAGLSFSDVTAAIRSMSQEGGQFFGLLERRSQTFTGLISTLKAAWTDVRQAFGKPFNDSLKPIIQSAIESVTGLMEKAKALGEKVGRAITIAFVAFKEGRMGDLFGASLELGIAVAMDKLFLGLKTAVAFLAAALPPIFASLGAKLSDPMFWKGLSLYFQGFGKLIGAEIRAAMPMPDMAKINNDKIFADMLLNSGSIQMGLAGGGTDLGEVMTTALDAGLKNASRVLNEGGAESTRTTEARAGLNEITASLKASADALQKKTAEQTKLNEADARGIVTPDLAAETATTAMKSAMGALTTSQGRVGGGFGMSFGTLASIGQKTNKLLGSIDKKIGGNNTTPIPVLA
jgi:tape measure domain-containing protein